MIHFKSKVTKIRPPSILNNTIRQLLNNAILSIFCFKAFQLNG